MSLDTATRYADWTWPRMVCPRACWPIGAGRGGWEETRRRQSSAERHGGRTRQPGDIEAPAGANGTGAWWRKTRGVGPYPSEARGVRDVDARRVVHVLDAKPGTRGGARTEVGQLGHACASAHPPQHVRSLSEDKQATRPRKARRTGTARSGQRRQLPPGRRTAAFGASWRRSSGSGACFACSRDEIRYS